MNAIGVPRPDGQPGKWDEWTAVDELRRVAGNAAVQPSYGLAYRDMHQMEVMYQAQGLVTIRWLEQDVSFWRIAAEVAGIYPGQMNGARWYHHTGVRGFDGAAFLLANPAHTYQDVGQELDPWEWATWGDWRLLFVTGRI
jgi:hypothetical protein